MKGKTILELILLAVPAVILLLGDNINNSLIIASLLLLPMVSIVLLVKEKNKTLKIALVAVAIFLIIIGVYSAAIVATHQ